jgi:hypothetical protein
MMIIKTYILNLMRTTCFFYNLHRLEDTFYERERSFEVRKVKGLHWLATIDWSHWYLWHISNKSCPGTGLLVRFLYSVVCPSSTYYWLPLMTSLVSSNFSETILALFIFKLFVVKCDITCFYDRRLLHMINWCDQMIKKIPHRRYSSKSDRKIIVRGTLDTPITYIHDQTAHFTNTPLSVQFKIL